MEKVASLALWSIIVAFAVMGLKSVAWWITGSVALYSDALESIVNVIASTAAFWAIRVSHKPADRDHHHGHHKAEYFSAVAGRRLDRGRRVADHAEVWRTLQAPGPIEQPWHGSRGQRRRLDLNAGWAFLLIRAGTAARSPALVADGKHMMTDVVTSVGVIVGLVAAVLTGWTLLDPLLAFLVALNILWQGWKMIGASVDGLMDRAVGTDDHMRIRDIISANSKGALEIHDLKTRIAGRATFIEFHMVVNAGMTVGESHVICDRVEDALRQEIPSVRVIIHVEPDNEAKLPLGTVAVPFA